MSQTHYDQNPPAPARQPSNGLGTTGFVLGLVGLVLSPIPFIGVVAWPLVVLGIIFSAIGFARTRSGRATNKGLSIAGLVLSVVGLGVCLVWVFIVNAAVEEVEEEANREVTITYEVTGDAPAVDVDYTTYGDAVSSAQETGVPLPWSKEVRTEGLVKGGSLLVTTGEQGGSATCRVLVDGREAQTATASGPFAMADCSGF
ncbi:MmpS family transport accessory protein [Actinophytocola gossypii]|uniref:MmpS family transport accessory protein n=1 Tax=Actinophytocola gossypii TaxID=2812003 RepID=UPI0021A7BAB8|nr:MmpS family transport accessory protein [Actinophytocola gossypii]